MDTAYYAPGVVMVCEVLSAKDSEYDVFVPPAGPLEATATFYFTTTSLDALARKSGSAARNGLFADALPLRRVWLPRSPIRLGVATARRCGPRSAAVSSSD